MQVFKFGGASLKDADGIRQVGNIIQKNKDEHLIVVISAMGKITNALEQVYSYYIQNNSQKFEALQQVKIFHFNIITQLFNPNHEIFNEINQVFTQLEISIQSSPSVNIDFEYDKIVSMGEIISSKIVFQYLQLLNLSTTWCDIRTLLITDNNYREANILLDKSSKKIVTTMNPKGIYICQGFIGGTENGTHTTLGREGSDYTAAALAYMLHADSVTIWKDVPGILNADPRIMPDAIKLDRISYKEAIELAYYGAQIIHPKTIKPLQNKNIPLWVKPFLTPDEHGTLVQNVSEKMLLPPVYIFKYKQVLVSIMPKDFSFIAEENLSLIFKHLAECKIKVNMMEQSAISFSVCFDLDERKLRLFSNAMSEKFNVLYNTDLTLITIRHYTDEAVKSVIQNKKILVKELSRSTARIIIQSS